MIHIETSSLRIIPLSYDQLSGYIEKDKIEAEFNLITNERVVSERIKEKIIRQILPEMLEEKVDYIFYTFWIIIAKNENELAAEFCFKGKPQNGIVEIGYATFPKFRNHGIMTEALSEIINWTFSNTEVKGVIAETDPQNLASIKVLEKTYFSLFQSTPTDLTWKRER